MHLLYRRNPLHLHQRLVHYSGYMPTTKFTLPDNSFPHLQKFAAFLLKHHLQEAAEANIEIAKKVDLPLLKVFATKRAGDFLTFVQENLENFFQHLIEQNALEQAKEALRKGRDGTLPHIPKGGVATADMVLVYHVRRQVLLSFVGRYTREVDEAISIAKELDALYAQVERFAFGQFVDFKEEEHRTMLLELQDKNNELATTLEELQAAEEQLLEANNELEQRVAERTQKLADSEQQLRIITDSLPGLITYIDRDERYRFLNKTYEEWFGVSRFVAVGKKVEEIYGLRTGKMMVSAAHDQVNPNIQRVLNGEPLQYETTLFTKNGVARHVLVSYVPHIAEEQVLGYYVLATDISKHIEAEEALKKSEVRFSNIFNQSSVGMAEVDLTGRFVMVNDRYCQMVGRSREALYQMRMQDISHDQDLPQNISLFQQAVQQGDPFAIEKRYTRPDGSQIWVRNNVSVVKDEEGRPISVVAISQDITERVEAEKALKESSDRFRDFADNIQNLAWMANPDGNTFWYNQRWYHYTGTSFEEMRGFNWEKLLHPNHKERVLAFVKNAIKKGETWEFTFPLRRADGEWGWFLTRGFAVKDEEGQVVRWIGTNTEITEQVKAQEQLEQANEEIVDLLQRETAALEEAQQQRKRLYNLFMQAPSLLCITRGRDFIYELANPSYLEALMVDATIIGKPLREVLPDTDPSVMQIYNRVFERGERFVGNELPVTGDWKRNEQPYTRYFNLIYEPIRELDGRVSGIITFGYEVTEQVIARQELEQNAVQMQEMNQELSQKYIELSRINNDLDNFMYTASHDLRSPLLNLEGLLIALNKRLSESITPQVDTLLELAVTSVEKLKRTIKDLTEITKAQKGLDEINEAVSFKEILEDIKPDLPQSFDDLGTFLKEDFKVTLIRYSRAGLRSILYNLLSNAIKYKSDVRPLEICISTHKEDEYVVLTVEDNGLGIPEKQLSKLFMMFTRLHTHVEGTGIGLYTIKRIVENAGGRIEVSSQVDKGSAFKVYIAQ